MKMVFFSGCWILNGWIGYIRSWLLLLMYSLLGVLLLYAVIIVTKEKLREQLQSGKMGKRFTLKRMLMVLTGERAIQRASKFGLLLFGVVIGFGWGFGYRDHQLTGNVVTYTEVLVQPPSMPDNDFDLQPERMRPIPSKICQSQVDWRYGETLADLTFEQLRGCKRVISYHRYTGGINNARLSFR